jgi:hypothetical protein
MLTNANMGGMEEMGVFYTHCLEELYPPGSCGTFCNKKTYDCYLSEVHESCCDEDGTNCIDGQDVPNECPVGCALVFPEFMEICTDHIRDQEGMNVDDFQTFSDGCLEADGLELIEYALDLRAKGCTIDLDVAGGHRRVQLLSQWLDSDVEGCSWDEVNDIAREVDSICGSEGTVAPDICEPACAVAMHEFAIKCEETLDDVLGATSAGVGMVDTFERQCAEDVEQNALFILGPGLLGALKRP